MNESTDSARAEELTVEECRDLLMHRSKVGRVGFVRDGQPMILPVNYLGEGDHVVFCTEEDTELGNLEEGAAVAFEVDSSRPLYHSGWSVLVTGTIHRITEPDELERLARSPLQNWAFRSPARWMRITIGELTGRRIPER